MNLLELIQGDGFVLKRKASTNGGEYAGACPFCGYEWDTFRVWPESGRYWCRRCEKSGDAIQYLRDKKSLSYKEACHKLGVIAALNKYGSRSARKVKPNFTPKETQTPVDIWQGKAKTLLDGAINNLWSSAGESMREWLHTKKGLSDDTIKKAMLGFNSADICEPRANWGLETALNDDGTQRRQWIPSGLVIPCIDGDTVQRLRIRRDNPGEGSRYIVASGSSSAAVIIGKDKGTAVIVESELDALLLSQEVGDLVNVIALGSAQAKPDKNTDALLKAMPIILICLDTDEAGARASWKFWPETYGDKVKRWPTIHGKDASEARLNGLNIRDWIIAGMFGSEEKFERFCIQTVEGGLSDREAIQVN